MLHKRLDHLPLKFLPEEHRLLRELKKHSVSGRELIVAVSGGVDSVVGLILLVRLQPILKNKIRVVHVHHGAGGVRGYRDKAEKFVSMLAKKLKLPLHIKKRAKTMEPLRSEESLRDFRLRALKQIQEQRAKKTNGSAILVLGHHQDDVLETQVMRLLRGTSGQGLQVMSFYERNAKVLRPLSLLDRKAILNIAKKLKVDWIDDPSNENLDPLRNWLRHDWLVRLEKKMPGAKASLARSLAHLADMSNTSLASMGESGFDTHGIDRSYYLSLTEYEKKAVVAKYIRFLKIYKYTQGQIEEICRRLDNRRGEYRFTTVDHIWRINTQRIKAEKV